jgi:4-hydroxybutyrate CoA-transferase
MERKDDLSGVQIMHMVPLTAAPYCEEPYCQSFRHVSVFSGGTTRNAINEGRADFIPRLFRRIPSLFTETFPLDVALIKVSPPDKHGYMSLGISVDYSKEAVRVAPLVIAEISSHVPRTLGDSFVHVSEVDYFVETNEPLVELPPPALTEVEMGIGKNVASLIQDGDCLQLGIGAIPDAVLRFLTEKNDLGIHSEMISDGVMGLMQAGNINNSRKQLLPGKCVIGFAMGTRAFYSWLDDNPATEFHPITFVNDPLMIKQNDNVVSVNSAISIDLLGQVAADMMGPKQFSAVGGQTDFVVGSMMSKNGRSIIALPATAAKGKVSRISVALERGQAVTTTRNDVQYVVTEYGVALLRGMTLRQRAAALINVAAPQFREQLSQECKELYGWTPEL